jgi:CheY-like chemotaxis protein
MRRTLAAVLLGLTASTATIGAAERDDRTGASLEQQVRQVLAEGVKLYHTGRFDQASATLRSGLAMMPEDGSDGQRLVYEFYLALGHAKVMAMAERAELDAVMKDVIRRFNIYQNHLRRQNAYIELLLGKLAQRAADGTGDDRVRLVATRELVAIGPIAVPLVLRHLVDTRQDDMRVHCRVVLTEMGYRAVIPLCEALKAKDTRLVTAVATALADIKDTRALPHLQRLIDDPQGNDVVKRVATNAVAAIAASAGIDALPAGSLMYYQEALRYFRDGDTVRDELNANEALVWRWNEAATEVAASEDGQTKVAVNLTYQTVPRYAWNELVAEQILFDGGAAYPEHSAYYPLMAAVLAAQVVDVGLHERIAKIRITNPTGPDETGGALGSRASALAEMDDRVLAFGAEHLYRAVEQSIVSERSDVAVHLMRLMQDRWLSRADQLLPAKDEGLLAAKPGTVLVAALDHGDKRIRYQAAITLAHLDPTLAFFGAEKVIPLLSEAVGEWGMRVALVVEPDYRERNAARKALLDRGFLVFTAADGFAARAALKLAPAKDVILVAGDLQPGLKDGMGVAINVPEQTTPGLIAALRADPLTEKTPIILSLPENAEMAGKIEVALAGKAQGQVRKPFDGAEMQSAIEAGLAQMPMGDVNRQEREDVALRAARALGALDPVRSQLPLTKAVDALMAAVPHRAAELRIAALRAIGHARAAERTDKITEIYLAQDAELAPEVRLAFIEAIGLLDPSKPQAVEILAKAMNFQDAAKPAVARSIRRAAHEAMGRGSVIPAQRILAVQTQQRLDVRAPGNGLAEAAPAAAPAAAAPAAAAEPAPAN